MLSKRCATSAKRSGNLLISTRNEPDGVSVEVQDSGPGFFAPAALERVFEAFYTTKPGGLGLGLSICRSIIEAHNGRLWASARTCPAAPAFNSPCRRSQTLRSDAALVSRPKEQATRPRVLPWVIRVVMGTSGVGAKRSFANCQCRGLGIRGRISPDRRSRKAREVRLNLVEGE